MKTNANSTVPRITLCAFGHSESVQFIFVLKFISEVRSKMSLYILKNNELHSE